MAKNYVVYGKSGCPYCVRAVDLLKSEGLKYVYINLEAFPEKVDQLKAMGCKSVPQIFLEDDETEESEHIGGFDQLCEHLGKSYQC